MALAPLRLRAALGLTLVSAAASGFGSMIGWSTRCQSTPSARGKVASGMFQLLNLFVSSAFAIAGPSVEQAAVIAWA